MNKEDFIATTNTEVANALETFKKEKNCRIEGICLCKSDNDFLYTGTLPLCLKNRFFEYYKYENYHFINFTGKKNKSHLIICNKNDFRNADELKFYFSKRKFQLIMEVRRSGKPLFCYILQKRDINTPVKLLKTNGNTKYLGFETAEKHSAMEWKKISLRHPHFSANEAKRLLF